MSKKKGIADIVFMIDASNSMEGAIESVKQSILHVWNRICKLKNHMKKNLNRAINSKKTDDYLFGALTKEAPALSVDNSRNIAVFVENSICKKFYMFCIIFCK